MNTQTAISIRSPSPIAMENEIQDDGHHENVQNDTNTGDAQAIQNDMRPSVAPVKEVRKNFSKAEDLQICRSYIAYCIDPISGTEKKGKVFWDDIGQHFNESLSEDDFVCHRTPDSIKTRWLNHIQPKTLKFSGYMRSTTKKASGSNYAYDVSAI